MKVDAIEGVVDTRKNTRMPQAEGRKTPSALWLGITLWFSVQVLVTPRRRLRSRNDTGNVGILTGPVHGRSGPPGLRLVATGGLELLPLLASSLAGALVLSRT